MPPSRKTIHDVVQVTQKRVSSLPFTTVSVTDSNTGVPGRVGKFLILHVFKHFYFHFQLFCRFKAKISGVFLGDARILLGKAGLSLKRSVLSSKY